MKPLTALTQAARLNPAVRLFALALAFGTATTLRAGAQDAGSSAPTASHNCDISGRALAGTTPLPGVAILVADRDSGKTVASSSSDIDGSYSVNVPEGRYVLKSDFAAFTPVSQAVIVNSMFCHVHVDLTMTLLSRAQQAPTTQSARRQVGGAGGGNRFESLGLENPAGGDAFGQQGDSGANGGGQTAGLPAPSFATGSTETVAVSGGANAQSNTFQFGDSPDGADRIGEMRYNQVGGSPAGAQAFGGGGGFASGPGGMGGGGFGGPGGGPGGGGFRIGGGRGRFNINQPHGSLFYSVGDSAFDAKPFSLTGAPTTQPQFLQQRFGVTIGGPLNIPKVYHGGTKTFFFVNYFGNRSDNPYDNFATVPTLAERAGDFSGVTARSGANGGLPVQLIDPTTGQPFANNIIPKSLWNQSAMGLLQYIPTPNLPGSVQNFHYITSVTNNNENLNLRLIRNFGGSQGPGRQGRGHRNNINFGLHYMESTNVLTNPFPSLGGQTHTSGWDVPVGWVKSKGHLTNNLRFDYNRSYLQTTNLYNSVLNVAGGLGIAGVSQDPFSWGLPSLSFTNFTGLANVSPQQRLNQTFTVSDNVALIHGKHTFRFGGDYRELFNNLRSAPNANGSFVFTGLYSGYDFADFLLGMAQQASVQYGSNTYNFRGDVYDAYFMDDWKMRSNLTVNAGLRYEYYSPLTETNNQMVNLDIAPGFIAAVPVLPGQTGPYTGAYPNTLINPDRNNFAPRVGVAWKPLSQTVVRAGYGINYNTSAYSSMALNMAIQPPFAFAETNVGTAVSPILLQNAFSTSQGALTTNNFAVDRNYKLGYVQIWNLNVQREIGRTLVINLDYTGTKGTHLDMLSAPNRTPLGLLIPGVQPFYWETSNADSTLHAGTLRIRKRMANGLSIGGTYVYSKSIDNASTIGAGGALVSSFGQGSGLASLGTEMVAQNPFDLSAERGLSSFDQRHRLTLDYLYELPLGMNKRWLNTSNWAEKVFGDWQWSGSATIASGLPFTPRVLGSFTDVASGVNGTLRPDLTGVPISVADPTLGEWFNPAAFVVPPVGQYGDARRNSIEGPGTFLFNMAIAKQIPMGEMKNLELRLQANNVFNTPQYTAIDTIVNSPTFGRVTAVGSMRQVQILARFRF